MATQHQYYQPATLPLNVPSKAPAATSLYSISRVAGSPPEISDSSTSGGSRTSGLSLTSGSISGDYDSSSLSYSGVDVVEVLSDRMQNVFDPTPLDKGLVIQAQTYVHHRSLLRGRKRKEDTSLSLVSISNEELQILPHFLYRR